MIIPFTQNDKKIYIYTRNIQIHAREKKKTTNNHISFQFNCCTNQTAYTEKFMAKSLGTTDSNQANKMISTTRHAHPLLCKAFINFIYIHKHTTTGTRINTHTQAFTKKYKHNPCSICSNTLTKINLTRANIYVCWSHHTHKHTYTPINTYKYT